MKFARIKRFVVTIIGFTVLIIGILLIVFPGPAFIVIPIGLAILATEYEWAKKIFDKIKGLFHRTFSK
jgi:tellurite resistance protein TerC